VDLNLSYEIKAEAFYRMTGHMAPGKDVAPGFHQEPLKERTKAWENWLKEYDEIIRAMLFAVGTVS